MTKFEMRFLSKQAVLDYLARCSELCPDTLSDKAVCFFRNSVELLDMSAPTAIARDSAVCRDVVPVVYLRYERVKYQSDYSADYKMAAASDTEQMLLSIDYIVRGVDPLPEFPVNAMRE